MYCRVEAGLCAMMTPGGVDAGGDCAGMAKTERMTIAAPLAEQLGIGWCDMHVGAPRWLGSAEPFLPRSLIAGEPGPPAWPPASNAMLRLYRPVAHLNEDLAAGLAQNLRAGSHRRHGHEVLLDGGQQEHGEALIRP